MEESTFSSTVKNSLALTTTDVLNEIKPPVQLTSTNKSTTETASNDDDDADDDDEVEGNVNNYDDIREDVHVDCTGIVESLEHKNDKSEPEQTVLEL